VAQALEFVLSRRWRLRITWPGREGECVVDGDRALAGQVARFAADPEVLDIRYERYFGSQPPAVWVIREHLHAA